MIYADYLSTAEMQRWTLDTDIAWDDIDPRLAHRDTALLQRMRDSALIESFFPIFTCRAMEVLWDDVSCDRGIQHPAVRVLQALSRVQPIPRAC